MGIANDHLLFWKAAASSFPVKANSASLLRITSSVMSADAFADPNTCPEPGDCSLSKFPITYLFKAFNDIREFHKLFTNLVHLHYFFISEYLN